MTQNKKGFTLIELVVVMALIAILAALGVGAIIVARNTAKETTHKSNAKTIQTGLEAFFAKNGTYPTAGTYSFTTASGSSYANVSLASTAECTVAAQSGGGSLVITSTGYTITPYDAACTTALTGTAVITGP